MIVTMASMFFSSLATEIPPKPPPMMTICFLYVFILMLDLQDIKSIKIYKRSIYLLYVFVTKQVPLQAVILINGKFFFQSRKIVDHGPPWWRVVDPFRNIHGTGFNEFECCFKTPFTLVAPIFGGIVHHGKLYRKTI